MNSFPANACTDFTPPKPPTGTLVCLAGINSGDYLFAGALQAMGATWRIIAINPPGVAGMPLELPLTVEKYAKQALHLLGEKNIEGPIVLLGHSMGGFAAQELVRLNPVLVDKLILVSTSRGQPDTTKDMARMPLKTGLDFWSFQRLLEKNPEAGQKYLFGPGFPLREGVRYQQFLQQRKAYLPSQAATLAHLTAGGSFSSTSWVSTLTPPTLVIHGDADILVTHESGQKLAQNVPHARFLSLYGVGHFPMLEHPTFWSYVDAFARGTTLGEESEAPRGFFQRLKERWWRAS